MTTYTPLAWEDEIPGETPFTYDISGLAAGKTIVPHVAVTPGTPVDATNMNHIEQGIEDAQNDANAAQADADNALAPVIARQGNVGDWSENAGTNNYDLDKTDEVKEQVGCFLSTLGGDTITFPYEFTSKPIVTLQTGNYLGVAAFYISIPTSITGSHFIAHTYSQNGGTTAAAQNVYVTWRAVGKLAA